MFNHEKHTSSNLPDINDGYIATWRLFGGDEDSNENNCTVSPFTIELGAEPLLTLTYSNDVDFAYWNVYDESGNQVTLTYKGDEFDELREDQDAVRPGTVMPLRMAYEFPATGLYTIIDGDQIGHRQ